VGYAHQFINGVRSTPYYHIIVKVLVMSEQGRILKKIVRRVRDFLSRKRRSLSEGELKILRLIQKYYGALNTEDEIIFDDNDKAVIWIKDETGDTILMVNLTNLAAWRVDGVIPSEEDLLSDWLNVK
jgi:hypothetical protein